MRLGRGGLAGLVIVMAVCGAARGEDSPAAAGEARVKELEQKLDAVTQERDALKVRLEAAEAELAKVASKPVAATGGAARAGEKAATWIVTVVSVSDGGQKELEKQLEANKDAERSAKQAALDADQKYQAEQGKLARNKANHPKKKQFDESGVNAADTARQAAQAAAREAAQKVTAVQWQLNNKKPFRLVTGKLDDGTQVNVFADGPGVTLVDGLEAGKKYKVEGTGGVVQGVLRIKMRGVQAAE